METENNKLIQNQPIPLALQRVSKKPIVEFLNQGDLASIRAILPAKIEDAVKGTPVCMLAKVVDPAKIEYFLSAELVILSSMINVDQRLNLQKHQVSEIAKALISEYPTENLADFKICFKRGAMGKYDEKLLRLDMAVIMRWMMLYLEEKWEVMEKQLYEEKDDQYKQIETTSLEALQRDWLEEWKQSNGYVEKVANNSNENGYQRFKLSDHQTKEEEALKRELHFEWIRANHNPITGKPIEGWKSEEEWLKERTSITP